MGQRSEPQGVSEDFNSQEDGQSVAKTEYRGMTHDEKVELAKVVEGEKTTRTKWICGTTCVGLLATAWCVQALSQPPWVAIVLALIGSPGLIWGLLQLLIEYIRRTNRKFQVMEKLVDPNRTSSNLYGKKKEKK